MEGNKIYLAKIDDYDDYDKASVIFSIPNLIDKGKAYSKFPEKKPAIGDEIIVFKMNSQLNAMWYYLPISQTGEFILEYNGSNIIMKDGKIYIQASQIHFNNTVNDRDTKEGDQSMVNGDKLKDLLDQLIECLTTSYSVITPQGPSAGVSPAAVLKLNNIKAQFSQILSTYAKLVK